MLAVLLPLLATLVSIPATSAHAMFQELWVGSTDEGSTCVRMPWRNSPVTDVTSTDIACNTATSAASPGYCSVAAGGSLTVEMHSQPNDRSCSVAAIGGDHDGPVIIYMAKVDNALTADGATAKWFKVAQSGYQGNNYWATDALNDNCGKFTFTVPSCLPAGEYLVRAEVIALHVAYGLGGAQFYMSCYTVKVTGGGSASPSTVSLPGAYSATDPGILFDLYGGFTSYTIPGPPVFSCGGGTGSTAVSSSSTRVSSSSTSSTRVSSTSSTRVSSTTSTSSRTSSTSSASQSSSSGQSLYGQCGGQGWTGPTTCAQGTCKVLNPFYSQCT